MVSRRDQRRGGPFPCSGDVAEIQRARACESQGGSHPIPPAISNPYVHDQDVLRADQRPLPDMYHTDHCETPGGFRRRTLARRQGDDVLIWRDRAKRLSPWEGDSALWRGCTRKTSGLFWYPVNGLWLSTPLLSPSTLLLIQAHSTQGQSQGYTDSKDSRTCRGKPLFSTRLDRLRKLVLPRYRF
jgi:hypothetical protein